MTSLQESKLNMFLAVSNQFAPDASRTTVLPPALTTALTAFNTVVSSIQSLAEQQVQAITGTATDKTAAKETLARLVNSTAAALYGYAASVSDNALVEKTDYSFSALRKSKDTSSRRQTPSGAYPLLLF
jgi:hypothetical protein